MFTIFAQSFGILFVLSLLYVMVVECHACSVAEKKYAPRQMRSRRSAKTFRRIAMNTGFYEKTKR